MCPCSLSLKVKQGLASPKEFRLSHLVRLVGAFLGVTLLAAMLMNLHGVAFADETDAAQKGVSEATDKRGSMEDDSFLFSSSLLSRLQSEDRDNQGDQGNGGDRNDQGSAVDSPMRMVVPWYDGESIVGDFMSLRLPDDVIVAEGEIGDGGLWRSWKWRPFDTSSAGDIGQIAMTIPYDVDEMGSIEQILNDLVPDAASLALSDTYHVMNETIEFDADVYRSDGDAACYVVTIEMASEAESSALAQSVIIYAGSSSGMNRTAWDLLSGITSRDVSMHLIPAAIEYAEGDSASLRIDGGYYVGADGVLVTAKGMNFLVDGKPSEEVMSYLGYVVPTGGDTGSGPYDIANIFESYFGGRCGERVATSVSRGIAYAVYQMTDVIPGQDGYCTLVLFPDGNAIAILVSYGRGDEQAQLEALDMATRILVTDRFEDSGSMILQEPSEELR